MAERLQFRNQFLVVVDLAIENDAHRTIFVVQRLLAGGEIDDRKAAMSEADTRLHVRPSFVRPAVELRLVHALQNRAVNFAPAAGVKDSGDAAHAADISSGNRPIAGYCPGAA